MNKPLFCVGKDAFERMNYLYQISHMLAPTNSNGDSLAFRYTNLMVDISKKSVQRLDIPLKRTICKRCKSLFIPGVSAKVRTKKKKLIYQCLKCNSRRVFDLRNKDYQPWTLQKKSEAEILEF